MNILDSNCCYDSVPIQELKIMCLFPLGFQVLPERIFSLWWKLKVKHEVRSLGIYAAKLISIWAELNLFYCGFLSCKFQVSSIKVAKRSWLVKSLVKFKCRHNSFLIAWQIHRYLWVRAYSIWILIMINPFWTSFIQQVMQRLPIPCFKRLWLNIYQNHVIPSIWLWKVNRLGSIQFWNSPINSWMLRNINFWELIKSM